MSKEYEEEKDSKKEKIQSFQTQLSTEKTNLRIEQMNFMDKMTLDLDIIKRYEFYYPEQNYENVAEKLNKTCERKRKRMKSMFNIFFFSQSQPKIKTSILQMKQNNNRKELSRFNKFFGKRDSAKFLQKKTKIGSKKKLKKQFGGRFVQMYFWILRCLRKKYH